MARNPSPPGPAVTPPRSTRPLWGDIALLPADRASGVEALAHIEAGDRASQAELTILARLRPGTYAAHLHGGSCEAPSASVAQLGALTAGPDGRAQLVVTRLTGPGGAQILTLDLIANAENALDIHDATGMLVACGDIPTIGVR